MEEWKEYRLGDFMEFNPKISLKKDTVARKITMDQLVPHSRDIYSWTYEPYSGGAKFQNGDTIMARITPCLENGKHAFISLLDENEIAYGSTEYIVMRGRKGISDNLFVYYLTHFPSFKDAAIKSMVGTSGRQRAQVDVVKNLTMKLPSIAEQKSIADILTKLDDKIAVNKQINDNFYFIFLEVMLIWLLTSLRNDNLEQQAQALFKSWFIDFEPFRDQPFVESELGMIPEGWRVGTICELIEIKYGKDHKKLSDGEIPVYGSGGLMRKCECALYNGESVLIPRKGTLNNVMYVNEAFWTVDTMFYSIPKIDNVVLFTYLYLHGKDLVSMNSGSAVPSMTTEILNNMKIVIPTKMVIRDFNIKVTSFYSRIKHGDEESRILAQLRDTLLPRLMSGEIKVGDVTL